MNMHTILRVGSISGWLAFVASWLVPLLDVPITANVEVIVIALTGIIAVVSTLIGVINTAKNDAFKNSQTLVVMLQKDLKRTRREKEYDHSLYLWSEENTRTLTKILMANNLEVPLFPSMPVRDPIEDDD